MYVKNKSLQLEFNHIKYKIDSPITSFIDRAPFKLLFEDPTKSIFQKFSTTLYSAFRALHSLKKLTPVYQIVSLVKLNYLYNASYGNYALLLYTNKRKLLTVIKLPSGKSIYVQSWALGFIGRNELVLKEKYIPQYSKYNFRNKKMKVRGVAMNPVDHHNGGRAKKKPLFLNKYNNIAKNNK
jgi:hypothetical protein